MTAKKQIPNYSIDTIRGEGRAPEDLIAAPFGEYLRTRNYLFEPHRHSFYHLVYFAGGGGRHSIDFVSFPVRPGQIYFMNPGQVHHWEFTGDVDGYIVNFPARFFQMLLANAQYLEQFTFFNGRPADQVIDLSPAGQQEVTGILGRVMAEASGRGTHAGDMILTLLLQLFITVDRLAGGASQGISSKPGQLVLRNFRKQVEENFMKKKLPKEYAALLYVTPNYLNSLCQDLLGISAGEVIRERIVLEAKRLLVNGGLSITEIAYRLNFQDNSYFTKFFKKYAGTTPEEFRRLHHIVITNQ